MSKLVKELKREKRKLDSKLEFGIITPEEYLKQLTRIQEQIFADQKMDPSTDLFGDFILSLSD